jgi:hypothetical protein
VGLIRVKGSNPFNGQSDPYISMDSSISYQEGKAEVKNSYVLNGVLTGCDKSTLINLQDQLVNSFDWEQDPSIPSNIVIQGVVSSNDKKQLIPNSLSFEDSNYIGSIGYTISLEMFTGNSESEEDEDLINKTHTETTNIDEKGCVSISTSISCEPNQNLTGCGSIEAANKWISGQLGKTKLGEITRTKNIPLQNESLTINPMTSALSYSSSHSQKCDDITNAGVPHSGFQLAFCQEENLRDASCPSGLSDTQYNGEVYKSGASERELVSYFNTGFLYSYPNKKELSINYDNQQDSINFSFKSLTRSGNLVFEPQDIILNNYTITESIDYHNGESKSNSINGTLSILNKINRQKEDVLDMTDKEVLDRAHSIISGEGKLNSTNVSRNLEEGSISYNASYSDGSDGENASPPTSYKINYTPSLYSFNVQGSTGCEKIYKSKCQKRGNLSISVTVASGTGWNYTSVASEEIERLKGAYGGGNEIRTEDGDTEYTEDKTSITINFKGSFLGEAANQSNNILSSIF